MGEQLMRESLLKELQRMYESGMSLKTLHTMGMDQISYIKDLASLTSTKCSHVLFEVYTDASTLRSKYPHYYRHANYEIDRQKSLWTRRLVYRDDSVGINIDHETGSSQEK